MAFPSSPSHQTSSKILLETEMAPKAPVSNVLFVLATTDAGDDSEAAELTLITQEEQGWILISFFFFF